MMFCGVAMCTDGKNDVGKMGQTWDKQFSLYDTIWWVFFVLLLEYNNYGTKQMKEFNRNATL